jgi:hypothetical protein
MVHAGIEGWHEIVSADELARRRNEFNTRASKYTKIRNWYRGKIGFDPLVYHPAAGADPVSYRVFGSNVILGSLQESSYFDWIRGSL